MSKFTSVETLEKWAALIDRLVYAQKINRFVWEDGPLPDSVIAKVGEAILTIRQDDNDYFVSISDSAGNVVDFFSDEDLDSGTGDRKYLRALQNLFKSIKREILGADQVLDDLLGILAPDPNQNPF